MYGQMVSVSFWCFLICIRGGIGRWEHLQKIQLNVSCLLSVLDGEERCWSGG